MRSIDLQVNQRKRLSGVRLYVSLGAVVGWGMQKPLSLKRRQIVLFAVCGAMLATFPLLVLLPLRQAHLVSDPPYFMGVGLCLGLSIACLAKAFAGLIGGKSSRSGVL